MAAKWYDWLVKRALATLQLTEKEILELEIREHQNSQKFSMMVKAQEYYQNKTDIRNKKNKMSHGNKTVRFHLVYSVS